MNIISYPFYSNVGARIYPTGDNFPDGGGKGGDNNLKGDNRDRLKKTENV